MYRFDVEKATSDCINWIKNWIINNGNNYTKAVIGISGGKDSTVCAKLLCEALGKDRVIGVMMPNGEQKDISDSIEVCKLLGIDSYTINISEAFNALSRNIVHDNDPYSIFAETEQNETNTPARLRMTALYSLGALIGNCRVVNTGNLSEEVLGYSTYGGDGFGDFAPIIHLTTEEVVAIGDHLGLPYNLTHKTPSDGMCGKSDEDNLGFTYHEVNELIRNNIQGEHKEEILKKYRANKFKTDNIRLPYFDPELPNYIN